MSTATQAPVQTTLAAMQAPQQQHMPAVKAGVFDLAGFELMQRVSKAFASSSLVPKQYQGNVANCMIALNLARRLQADELMVMQNLYIVHGNPGWSSKFLIASINSSGRFSALRYEWRGEKGKQDFGCRAWAIEKETGERLDGVWVDWGMVKAEGWADKSGSKWKTMPEQMFIYRAAAFWQRAYAPEISMGMNTAEELVDTIDMNDDGSYTVTAESLRTGTTAPVDVVDAETVDQKTGEVQQTVQEQAEVAKTEEQASQTDQQHLSYAKVADSLNGAKDLDVLDVAADLISQVADEQQKAELVELYKSRKESLLNPKPAEKAKPAASGMNLE